MSSFPDVTDRNVQYPNRYHTEDPASGAEEIIDITPQPGTGVEGTVLNKAFFDGVKAYIDSYAGTSGYSGQTYFTDIDSDVSGYKVVSHTPAATEVEKTISITNQESLWGTYLFTQAINTTIIDAGVWGFSFRAKVSSSSGDTKLRAEIFSRTSAGAETVLFSATSDDLNALTYADFLIQSTQPTFTVGTTDRLGVRIYAQTTRAAATSVYSIIGGQHGSYISAPLVLRHAQLRDKNGETDYQHMTNAEKVLLDGVPSHYQPLVNMGQYYIPIRNASGNGPYDNTIALDTFVHGNTTYGGTVVTNFDTIGHNGFYTGLGTATGAPDDSYSWFVLHQNSNTGTVSAYQRAIAYDNTKLIVFERVKTSSTWSAWYYTGANDFLVTTPAVTFTSSTLSHVIDLPWSITAPQHKITLTFVDMNGKYVIRTHEFNDIAFLQTGIADNFFNGTNACLYTVTTTDLTSITVSFSSLTNALTLASISMR